MKKDLDTRKDLEKEDLDTQFFELPKIWTPNPLSYSTTGSQTEKAFGVDF